MKYIDIHTHGGFGVNFNNCSKGDILFFATEAEKRNIVGFLPTLATDKIENITVQIEKIIEAKIEQKNGAKILGIHLEACFLNPEKAGVHKIDDFLKPNVENWEKFFKKYENDIKIVTLAPELDENNKLQKYLISKGIKVQAGHTKAENLGLADSICHIFNATPAIHHRESSATLEALINDNIYTEIIADTIHTSENILKMFFKVKNKDKILIISDSLPIANSKLESTIFCSQEIFKNGKTKDGTLAGSIQTIDTIVKNLINKGFITKEEAEKFAYQNQIEYLGIDRI